MLCRAARYHRLRIEHESKSRSGNIMTPQLIQGVYLVIHVTLCINKPFSLDMAQLEVLVIGKSVSMLSTNLEVGHKMSIGIAVRPVGI